MIAVCALYTKGSVHEGGSSRFIKCLVDELKKTHRVDVFSHQTPFTLTKPYKFVFTSHQIPKMTVKSPVIYYSQGLVAEEAQKKADFNLSQSVEVWRYWLEKTGIDSKILPQPVKMGEFLPPTSLKRILIIRRYKNQPDPFAFLYKDPRFEVVLSDPDRPIEEQIKKADLVISVGRGIIESMAHGKPVLIAANRPYIGNFGDGYLTMENLTKVANHNYSGRAFKHPITKDWLNREIDKFNPSDAEWIYEWAKTYDVARFVKELLSLT